MTQDYFYIFATNIYKTKKMNFSNKNHKQHRTNRTFALKKLIGIVVFTLLVVSCSQPKIGYVNVEEILKEYKGTKAAEKTMNEKSAQIKGQLDALAADYQKEVTDYYSKRTKMSVKQIQETEANLTQKNQLLSQQQQQAQAQVQKEGQEMMAEINETVADFVKDYAKTNGYSYVLGTSDQTKAVLYGDTTLDVTDAVLEALNDAYKKDKPSAKTDASSNN